MKTLSFLLMATALQAAEPRFQFRSFIQIDGTLMHVKLDTTTGQSWRLERTLTNRRDTTLAGKATEQKLDEVIHAKVVNLEGYTLAELLVVINTLNREKMGEDVVPVVFRDPATNPENGARQGRDELVPPTREFGEGPRGVDPATGLSLGPSGRRFQVDPVTGLPLVDPATGLPLLIGGVPGEGPQPPFTIGGIPRMHPRHPDTRQPTRLSPNIVKIRHWGKDLLDVSAIDLITELLNTLDAPVRCVIDENIVYLLPESATLTTRDGKTNKSKYEDRWVEIKTTKEK